MNRRFLTLVAVVLIPLLVLGVFAWRGVQAQRRAAWEEAREEANRIAAALAPEAGRQLKALAIPIHSYPDPPLPQSDPAAVVRLAEARDAISLRALRENADAGLSAAGLPIRVLAATRLLELEPSPENAAALATLALETAPSILTPAVLAAAETRGVTFAYGWREKWQSLERARLVALRNPAANRTLLTEPDGLWWLDRDSLTTLPPEALHSVLVTEVMNHLPNWAKLSFRTTDIHDFADEPFAQSPVTEFPNLSLQVIVPDRSLVEKSVHQQERWALGMIGSSLLAALIGLGLIQRTLAQERRLNEMKSQFVASVSHELRAPVASIRLMADALESGKVAPETAKEFHRLIAREGSRLATLIGNVLDHARIEQGRRVWNMEVCDLAGLVTDTLRVMEPLAEERNITLTADLAQVDASADAGAIQQALVNLLDNAIKFSPPGSIVTTTLSIYEERRSWELSVCDTGPGIAVSEQRRIFERFHRLGDELRRETQGTGIGLSLVKSIAEAHSGTVALRSHPGQGSTFTLIFPIISNP